MRLPTEDKRAALYKKDRPNNNLETLDLNLTQVQHFSKAKQNFSISLSSEIRIDPYTIDFCDCILKDNTFQNPQYIANQEQNRSNWQTEPTIKTYRYSQSGLFIPRGYLQELIELCHSKGIKPQIEDHRATAAMDYPTSLKEVSLRHYQSRSVEEALRHEEGVIVSPTGSGKTFIGLELIRRLQQKSLIIVHKLDLAKQWIEIIEEKLDTKAGFIGDGQWSVGEKITVALVQSLASKESETKSLKIMFGLVLLDEVHHAPAHTFFEVLKILEAKYRYGLSATLGRRDGLMPMIFLTVGGVIAEVYRNEVEDANATVPVEAHVRGTGFDPGPVHSWNDYISALGASSERNLMIINIAAKCKSPTLILTDRVSHAEHLSGMLTRRNIDHVLAHGRIKDRSEALEASKLAKITIGTIALLGEGLDVSSWTILIMASPISSEIKLLQAVGRVVRASPGKEKAFIIDLRDDCGFSGSSFKKRFDIYKKNKIWVHF